MISGYSWISCMEHGSDSFTMLINLYLNNAIALSFDDNVVIEYVAIWQRFQNVQRASTRTT